MTDTTVSEPPPSAPSPIAKPRVWTRVWFPYLLALILGPLIGSGFAIHNVRSGAFGSGERIGAWETGRDFGTAAQSAKTRAIVALRGILALPASEARYYTATVDDSGAALAGNCTYRLTGGALPAKWWSVTLYDTDGYLVANAPNIFSVGSAALPAAEQNRWTIIMSPGEQPGRWLPTGNEAALALTLRAYLPADGGKGNFTAAQLPSIRKEGCA